LIHEEEGEMPKVTAVLATALIVATSGTASASDVEPGFGPSATGCPTFWEVDGGSTGPDIDPPVGPFGTSQIHVTGFGFSVDGETITATIRVADMRPRVAPGFNQSWWSAGFGSKSFLATYDLLTGLFTFTWIDLDMRTSGPATGSVVPGPGGGVRITAKMADLGIGPYYEADATRVLAGPRIVAEVPGHAYIGGPAPTWSRADGPELVPLVACPGLSFSVRLDPRHEGGVVANGITLPKVGGQPVELQLLSDGEWTTIATGTTDQDGAFEITGTLPPDPATVRGTVTTAAGIGTSAPVDIDAR
jgi:hypothetical protein